MSVTNTLCFLWLLPSNHQLNAKVQQFASAATRFCQTVNRNLVHACIILFEWLMQLYIIISRSRQRGRKYVPGIGKKKKGGLKS